MIPCKNVMTRTVVAVNPQDSIQEVTDELLRHSISGLPVIDEQQRVLGVISEFDLLRLLFEKDTVEAKVADYMTTDVITISEEASITDAADIFLAQPIRRLPVVRDDRMVGMISRRDLIRVIRDIRQRFAEALEKRIHVPISQFSSGGTEAPNEATISSTT